MTVIRLSMLCVACCLSAFLPSPLGGQENTKVDDNADKTSKPSAGKFPVRSIAVLRGDCGHEPEDPE